jgi:hypothetical protein
MARQECKDWYYKYLCPESGAQRQRISQRQPVPPRGDASKLRGEERIDFEEGDTVRASPIPDDKTAGEMTGQIASGAKGMERREGGKLSDTLENAGDTVNQVHEGLELAGVGEERRWLKAAKPWVKAANAPAIVQKLREGDYLGAIDTLRKTFSPDEVLEGLIMVCEKLGLHRAVKLLPKFLPAATGVGVLIELIDWTYEGFKAIREAHEAGDLQARVRVYAQAFVDTFLNGQPSNDTKNGITSREKEALDLGWRDGAETFRRTGDKAVPVVIALGRKYGGEKGVRTELIGALLKQAGYGVYK